MSDSEQQEPRIPEPKIIVDEDWKTQVQAEKKTLKDEQTQQPEAPGAAELPPASMALLITTLATQALAMLGQIPDPNDGSTIVHLDQAKHVIDTLAVLEEKTKGNLTADEATMLQSVLHEMRMLYIAVQNQPTATNPAAGESV